MHLSVKEIAELTGVSVRTLHYYDEIGLLKPEEVKANGYRYYNEENVALLQQIIFLRELEFSLKEIARILALPDYDRNFVLVRQKDLLRNKKRHLDALIRLIDKTTGGIEMKEKNKEKLTDAAEMKSRYAKEVKERWGDTAAFAESEKKHAAYDGHDEKTIAAAADEIFAAFAALRDLDPGDEKVQELVKTWQAHITNYHYHCTKEILAGLGQMYTADERFQKNLDRFGEGTAALMRDAIAVYCSK